MRQSSLVVVANRLPLDDNAAPDGACEWRRSPGGLASALHAILQQTPATWVGWAGGVGPARAARHRTPAAAPRRAQPRRSCAAITRASPTPPVAALPRRRRAAVFDRGWWETYRDVNRRFAEAAAEVAEPGAAVWVQDYHLQLVPQLLRELRPDLLIGFFLHVPFPPPELFMQLPRRVELLRGMLGADLVGFQRPQAAHNVAQLAAKLLGAGRRRRITSTAGWCAPARSRSPSTSPRWQALSARPDVVNRPGSCAPTSAQTRRCCSAWTGWTTPRASSTASPRTASCCRRPGEGPRHRDGAGRGAQPGTGGQLPRLRDRIEREVGRINGEYGRVGEPAIHYLNQPFDRADLAALYQTADVMVVTPLRDGMNLVAKEYVAARADDTGALVLSEFAGAAAELAERSWSTRTTWTG